MTLFLTVYTLSFLGCAYYSLSRINTMIRTGEDPTISKEDIELIKEAPMFQRIVSIIVALIPGFNTYSLLTFVFYKD